jgi:hypothetical protein
MFVKAKKGCAVPYEDLSGKMITDGELIEVPDTTYYRRLVMDGSLMTDLPEAEDKKPGEPGSDKTKKGGRS